jgi:hypothetical protein
MKQPEPFAELSVSQITEKLADLGDDSLVAFKAKDIKEFANISGQIVLLNCALWGRLANKPDFDTIGCMRTIIQNCLWSGNTDAISTMLKLIGITDKAGIAEYMILNKF